MSRDVVVDGAAGVAATAPDWGDFDEELDEKDNIKAIAAKPATATDARRRTTNPLFG